MQCIEHVSEIASFASPGQRATANRRLVDADFGGTFEMILAEIEPHGEALPHAREGTLQCIFVLDGEAEIRLDSATRRCGPDTIVRIPPGMVHDVRNAGARPLRVIVVYSPPLPARDELPAL